MTFRQKLVATIGFVIGLIIANALMDKAEARGHSARYQYQDPYHGLYSAPARYHRHHASRAHKKYSKARKQREHLLSFDANGNLASGVIRSAKTGAVARVAPAYAPRFQSYINDIESTGAQVLFMGGYRNVRCSPGHQHGCGKALDVCQLARGDVDERCHLPGRVVMGALALKNGLFEGALWCDNDYGHAQVDISADACRKNLYAAVRKFKEKITAAVDEAIDPEAKAYDYSLVTVANVKEDGGAKLSARRVASRRHHHHRSYATRHHYRHHHRYASS